MNLGGGHALCLSVVFPSVLPTETLKGSSTGPESIREPNTVLRNQIPVLNRSEEPAQEKSVLLSKKRYKNRP